MPAMEKTAHKPGENTMQVVGAAQNDVVKQEPNNR